MKTWQVAILIMFLIIIMLYIAFNDVMNKIDLSVGFDGVSSNISSFSDIKTFLAGEGAITLNFIIQLKNLSWLKIPLRDLETRVFYKGQLIGNSSRLALKNIDIYPGSFKQWIEPIDIMANKDVLGLLLGDLTRGVDPKMNYETEIKVWGIRYTYRDQVKIIKTTLESL